MGVMGSKRVTRRVVLGSIAGGLAGAAVILRTFKDRYATTLPRAPHTDLAPEDFKDACEALVQEREMWARLRMMSGRITATTTDPQTQRSDTIQGDMSFERLASSTPPKRGVPWKYVLKISSQSSDWSLSADSETGECDVRAQGAAREAIAAVNPNAICDTLSTPRDILLCLYCDSLCPLEGAGTFDEFLSLQPPWHDERASSPTRSYVWKCNTGKQSRIFFEDGHFAGWCVKAWKEDPAVDLRVNGVTQSDGFWYPKQFVVHARGKVRQIDLSDVTIAA